MNVIGVEWSELKTFVQDKNISLQAVQSQGSWHVSAVEQSLIIQAIIPITSPANSDQTDFETNYLPLANRNLGTRILGSWADQMPIRSTSTGDLNTTNVSDNGGIEGIVSVGTTPILAKIGATNLDYRKNLTAFNNSNTTIYWGYTNSVTTSTGTPLFKNQFISWEVGSGTDVYLVAGSSSNEVRLTESA